MDRIVNTSQPCGGVTISDCAVQRLFFTDDLVQLDPTQSGFQQALDRFSDASMLPE